jgi:hypothetical protein
MRLNKLPRAILDKLPAGFLREIVELQDESSHQLLATMQPLSLKDCEQKRKWKILRHEVL